MGAERAGAEVKLRILAGLLLMSARLSDQTNLCGIVAEASFGLVQGYCVPDLSPYIPWAPNAATAQVWGKSHTRIAQPYYVILGYH